MNTFVTGLKEASAREASSDSEQKKESFFPKATVPVFQIEKIEEKSDDENEDIFVKSYQAGDNSCQDSLLPPLPSPSPSKAVLRPGPVNNTVSGHLNGFPTTFNFLEGINNEMFAPKPPEVCIIF